MYSELRLLIYNNIDKFNGMKKALALVAFSILGLACKVKEKKQFVSPPGYDLSQPVKLLLSDDLEEISGLYVNMKDSTIIVLNDEEGKLYTLDLNGKIKGKAFKFARKSDFEDLTTDGSYWYAIKSNGEIYRIAHAFTDSATTRVFPFFEQGWEFETLFYDGGRGKLVALAKNPLQWTDGRIPAFTLDTAAAAFQFDPYYAPDTASIARMHGKKKWECKPTAAAIHPITGETFILSVQDRLLLTMKGGVLNSLIHLDKSMFRQPEGIAFMPDGTMLISNEAQEGTANILRFAYQPK